jgi:hypothetical protein
MSQLKDTRESKKLKLSLRILGLQVPQVPILLAQQLLHLPSLPELELLYLLPVRLLPQQDQLSFVLTATHCRQLELRIIELRISTSLLCQSQNGEHLRTFKGKDAPLSNTLYNGAVLA